jgi:hypothetical protein
MTNLNILFDPSLEDKLIAFVAAKVQSTATREAPEITEHRVGGILSAPIVAPVLPASHSVADLQALAGGNLTRR